MEFLRWADSSGEKLAAGLDYAPLPDNLVKRVLATVDTIKY